jgi:predicted dehydrogenase
MDRERLGVAIRGAGSVAWAHAASWQRNPHCRIVSVSGRRRQSAAQLAEELGLGCAVRDHFEEALAVYQSARKGGPIKVSA